MTCRPVPDARAVVRLVVAGLLAIAATGWPAAPAGAQQTGVDTAQVADTVEVGADAEADPESVEPPDSATAIQPAGAFLRGAVLPGWGHAATGSATRGAFYFSMEALSGWMVYKTHQRLDTARRQAALWERQVTAELAAQGITDLEKIDAALEDHEEVARYRGRVNARTEQREDWLAVALFTLLLSGVDAYVSTHLMEFPEPLTIEGNPTSGVVELSLMVPLG